MSQPLDASPVEMVRGAGDPAIGPLYAMPLRAVDRLRVEERPDGLALYVTKLIDAGDPYLAAHFPGRTIYPGVFVLETVRQAVIAALGERMGVLADLIEVHSLRLIGAMHPGEQLCVEAAVQGPDQQSRYRVDAHCTRADGSDVARLRCGFGYGYDD